MVRLEAVCLFPGVALDQIFGNSVDPPERTADQRQQANTKPETDFPLQIGFAQDAFNASIGHAGILSD
jgi:hypothetical protein